MRVMKERMNKGLAFVGMKRRGSQLEKAFQLVNIFLIFFIKKKNRKKKRGGGGLLTNQQMKDKEG